MCALNLLAACVVALQNDLSTTTAFVVYKQGNLGAFAVLILSTIALIAVCDVVVNDLMPARFILRQAVTYRHTIYMAMALGCLSMIFVVIKNEGPSAVLLHYVIVAFASVLIAVFDIRDRLRNLQ
jgi:small-conductance mechanosensitive channel